MEASLASVSAAAAKLGVALDGASLARLARYAALVRKWSAITNLTAAETPAQFLEEHVVDCIAVVPHLPGPRVLDVGSGAGLPGIVLAIARADLTVTLLEPRAKRARFLTQAVIELELASVSVACERVEDYRPAVPYDDVVTRALGEFTKFVGAAGHLHERGARLTAMKADASAETLPGSEVPVRVIPLDVPGYRDRCLLRLDAPSAD